MGIRSSANLDPSSTIIRVLIDMYVDIGDHISLQYGGSEAHKKVTSDASIHGPIGKHKELLTSIRRYYSNAFTDRLKQDAMNLLLGYYIPYRHTIPLWELESDYYLHNLHVKAGKGTMYSMRTYQRAFGVEWDGDSESQADRDKISSPIALRRAKLAKLRQQSGDPRESRDNIHGVDSWRIDRVRRRLKSQNDSLSVWWKSAIQAHIKQRMWMQLGEGPHESLLPPRFERIYQPNKLAQFDRFFARSWATPVRRSHSAQHRQGIDENDTLDYRRVISDHALPKDNKKTEENDSPKDKTLLDFFSTNGYEPAHEPSLKRFISHHSNSESSTNKQTTRLFLGRIGEMETPCEEYLRYTSPPSDRSRSPFREEKIAEFKKCLYVNSMHSDDVEGIRKLGESAHLGRTLCSGPYRGLDQCESAVEVTTVIQEQFNALHSNPRSVDGGGMRLVDLELKRRGYHTAGVREAVARGWEKTKVAEAQYAEIVNKPKVACRRSDLTTAASLSLYASFFDDSTALSALNLTYICGERQTRPKSGESDGVNKNEASRKHEQNNFVSKASRLGVCIKSYADIAKEKAPPLFNFERSGEVQSGFEQINEDLFARKDNKFMVFNGAGMDSWNGTEPITKVATLTDDPFSLRDVSTSSQSDKLRSKAE